MIEHRADRRTRAAQGRRAQSGPLDQRHRRAHVLAVDHRRAAQWSGVPVINALSDLYHPCQALADMLTLKERFGSLRGLKLAFVGDGNNVAHSLMLCAARLGMDFVAGTPRGYEPDAEISPTARAACRGDQAARSSSRNDPVAAVAGAHAVYTDVWASMGQENEAERAPRAISALTR